MTPERWEKVRDLLGQVLELGPEKRPVSRKRMRE